MSLLKRGAVWWSYFFVDGVRYQQSTGTSNRRQAERIERKFKEEINARRHELVQVDPKLTFGDLAARFVANAGPKTYHLERLKHLLPYFAGIPIIRISKGLAREYRLYRKSLKPVSDATVNRDLSVLRHLLYWAVDESLLPANPLSRLRMERERRARRPVMSVEEELQLLKATPDHLSRVIIAALDTGMRRGEILSQLWEHVDFHRRLLAVTHSKTPEGEAREIPLTNRLFQSLEEHRQDEGPIFVYRGLPIRDVKKAWKHAINKAGIRYFRFHDLRHSFNTRLMEAGVLQEVRMALMGHVNPQRTHSTYTHVELPVKRDAIAKLEQWVEHQQQLIGGNDASTKAT